ncbi:MAG: hypothetical protein ACK55K_05060 [Bacteroidota bacterium]
MNKIILPPAILSTLLPNHTRIESSDNNLYLLREKFQTHKLTISNLYRLFFGMEPASAKEQKESNIDASAHDYYSSYE